MNHRSRGFSASELLTVVAITGIMFSLAINSFSTGQREGQVRKQILSLKKDIDLARRWVRTGRQDIQNFKGRVTSAGVQFHPNGYHLFVDADDEAGDETIVRSVVFSSHLVFTQMPNEVRFKPNGTLESGGDVILSIEDTQNKRSHGVSLSYAGHTEAHSAGFTK